MIGPIIALDLARHTGFAVGPIGGAPRVGVWILPGGLGPAYRALFDAVADLCEVHAPSLIVAEAPFAAVLQTHQATAELLMGLMAHVETVGHSYAVPVRTVAVGEWRKALFGPTRLRTEAAKARALQHARVRGWAAGGDHNAAEAGCLWEFACLHLGAGARMPR